MQNVVVVHYPAQGVPTVSTVGDVQIIVIDDRGTGQRSAARIGEVMERERMMKLLDTARWAENL